MTEIIRRDHADGIAELMLNRAPVNALSAAFLMAFADQIAALEADREVTAILLTSPFKVFSAGLDLKAAVDFDLDAQNAIVKGLNVGFLALYSCAKPVVVTLDGAAIAGGFFFVLGADWRVGTARAKVGLAEVRVGADFPIGPLEIARETLGADLARRLMLSGQPVAAQATGLMDEIVEPDDLQGAGIKAAQMLAGSPGATFARIKQQLRGETIARIEAGIAAGGNAPEGGWFGPETKPAMRKMLGG